MHHALIPRCATGDGHAPGHSPSQGTHVNGGGEARITTAGDLTTAASVAVSADARGGGTFVNHVGAAAVVANAGNCAITASPGSPGSPTADSG